MISILVFLSALVLGIGWLISTRSEATIKAPPVYRGDPERDVLNPQWIIKPIALIVLGLVISIFQPFQLTRVDAGHVAIEVHLTGDARGVGAYEYKTGWVTVNTWSRQLFEFPTFQQHIEYDTLDVIMKGGFSGRIKPTFNYALIPGAVGDMFQNLRKPISEVEQGWLKTAILSSVNDVANRWAVDDIFNDREMFENAIIVECNKRVSKWFNVSQLRSNIVPPGSLQKAIIDKTNQVTLAQAELSKALTADATAKVKIATAKGDSAQVVITAAGAAAAVIIAAEAEAKAMRLKQAQLSALYVDYTRVLQWDGKLSTTSLGSGTNALINLK